MSKNVMTYKGFISSIHFSADDDIFYGKIEGIEDLVSFEGASVVTLKKAFRDAADRYMEFCAKKKKPLQKSHTGTFNVRIKPESHQQAAILAKQLNQSLNQFVQQAIDRQIMLTLHEEKAVYRSKRKR
mgnify:CR=1 FL=1